MNAPILPGANGFLVEDRRGRGSAPCLNTVSGFTNTPFIDLRDIPPIGYTSLDPFVIL